MLSYEATLEKIAQGTLGVPGLYQMRVQTVYFSYKK